MSPKISVSIPYKGTHQYLLRAVTSCLEQSIKDVEVFVVVDGGDPSAAWESLAGIDDPRLHRIQLSHSRGPFYVHNLVLHAATDARYLLIQDSDDWSDPKRAELLLNEMELRDIAVAASSQIVHSESGEARESLSDRLTLPAGHRSALDRFRFHGLYNSEKMKKYGGFYGGYPFAFDGYLTGMLWMLNDFGYIDVPLYHRMKRPGSLTRDRGTGHESQERLRLAAIYRDMVARIGELSMVRTATPEAVARITLSHVSQGDREIMDHAIATVRDHVERKEVVHVDS